MKNIFKLVVCSQPKWLGLPRRQTFYAEDVTELNDKLQTQLARREVIAVEVYKYILPALVADKP